MTTKYTKKPKIKGFGYRAARARKKQPQEHRMSTPRPTKSEQCLISLLPDDILQNALVILTGTKASQGESENLALLALIQSFLPTGRALKVQTAVESQDCQE